MRQRILAALAAGATVLLLTPGRLAGEPASPPTTNLFGEPTPATPNPLTLYPRRPGAKYEDVEARPGAAVEMGFTRLRLLTWAVEPRAARPGLATPGALAHSRDLGLVDGYAPSATDTTGDLLHVVIRIKPISLPAATSCVATVATDGTVLLPYDLPPPNPGTTTSTTSTPPAVELGLYFPLGARRGRVYLTCRNSFFDSPFGEDRRAVWGFDV